MYAVPATAKPEPKLPPIKPAELDTTVSARTAATPAPLPATSGSNLPIDPTTAEKLLAQPSALDSALQQNTASLSSAQSTTLQSTTPQSTNQGLGVGDRGTAVVNLQQNLSEHGHDPGAIDGIFGNNTLNALTGFQTDAVASLRQSIIDAPPAARSILTGQLNRLEQEMTADVAGTETLLRLERTPAAPTSGVQPSAAVLTNTVPNAGELGIGDRGAAVTALQQNLNQHGHNPGTIDGIFGNNTLNALTSFQTEAAASLRQSIIDAPPAARGILTGQLNRLEQEMTDEVAGTETLLRLNRPPVDSTSSSQPPTTIPDAGELGIGSRGSEVGELQQQLTDQGYTQVGTVDNSFGPKTLDAVKAFQSDQIELLKEQLSGSVPPLTRARIQAQISALQHENQDNVAGATTQRLLDDPIVAAPVNEESISDILIDAIPDYSRRSDAQKQTLLDSVDTLANGNSDEKLAAALTLAGNLDQHQLRNIALKLDVTDSRVTRLATNTKAFAAAGVLADPNAADSEKLIATGELFQALGSTATGRTADILKPWLQGVRGATSVLQAWETWNDPNASATDKASAIIDAVSNVSKTAALLPQDAARILGNTGNAFKIASAAVTLFDPEASTADKALAVAHILDAATGLPKDYDSIRKILDGHVDVNQLNRIFDNLPAKHKLPAAIFDSLDPRVLDQLTHADADGLIKIGKELATTSGDESAEVLGRVLGKLDYDGVKDFTTFTKQLNGRSLDLFLQTADQISPRVLRTTLDVLKTADSTVVKSLSQVLDYTARALDAFDVKITREVAEKLAKSFGKALPVAGAAFAGYDAFQLGRKAFDNDLPDDLRYLAATGAKVNIGDAAYSIFEPLIAGATGGLGVAPDIALAGTSLAIDLVLAHEEGKLAEQGGNYEAPDWIGHTNVAVALGTNDLAGFYQIYGLSDGNAQITETLAAGGDVAIEGAQALAGLAGAGIEQAQVLTTELLRQGGPAGQHMINAISILPGGAGLDAVFDGLSDAGAAGQAALESLANAGVEKAQDFLNGLLNRLNPFS